MAIERKPTWAHAGKGTVSFIFTSSNMVSFSVRNATSSIAGDFGFNRSLNLKPKTSR